MSLDVDKALRRAARLMKNAELTAAETIYKDILTSFPKIQRPFGDING